MRIFWKFFVESFYKVFEVFFSVVLYVLLVGREGKVRVGVGSCGEDFGESR